MGCVSLHRLAAVWVMAAVGAVAAWVPSAGAAGGYGAAQLQCGFADPQIFESSGVAPASWAGDVIWTHNDSGDLPRFFAVNARTCVTLAVYDVTGAAAVDWEDMTRSGSTLYLGDIGDNPSRRASVTVYDVPEPARGTPSGAVRPAATRVLTYPDGPHDAETLLVDPTTGRLVIFTKTASGASAAYRAPTAGSGVMEKVADVRFPGATTGGDANAGRVVVRTYTAAYEWDVQPGESLAALLARPPEPLMLPSTPQGEAIAYTADGSGLWTTSERQGGPVHRLSRLELPTLPQPPAPVPAPAILPEVAVPALAVLSAILAIIALLAWQRRRVKREH